MNESRRISPKTQKDILALMEDGAEVLGLKLCFHDRLNRSGLPGQWIQHMLPCCEIHKYASRDRCTPFDTQRVHQELAGRPEGRIHRCPHGYTELAVPVFMDNLFAGVLFAGPCWLGRTPSPHPALVVPPNRTWLKKRLIILRSLASLLGDFLLSETAPADDRRRRILHYLQEHLTEPVRLTDLAKTLHLSTSRTGHAIRETFNTTFPRLLQNLRCQKAAGLLISGDLSVSRIAAEAGFEDSNYFSYVFSRQFNLSPLAYRKRHALKP